MLKKIVVKNVGVLRAFDTPNAPQLARLTTVYARNGRGKTTLSAVLRAAGEGDPVIIRGRRTLGASIPDPEVTLVAQDGSTIRFQNGKWKPSTAPIEVFDSSFIAENLHAGEQASLTQDRSLFTVILGREGVKLVRQQKFFNEAANRARTRLQDATKALEDDVPAGMPHEEFFALTPAADLDAQVEEAEKQLKSVQQSDRIAKLTPIEPLSVPALPKDLQGLLSRSVPDIDADARARLAAHFSKFRLGRDGRNFIRFGLEHIHGDDCPFCGRAGVDELGLVTVYRQIFGDAYANHFKLVLDTLAAAEEAVGLQSRRNLELKVATNGSTFQELSQFYRLGGLGLLDTAQIISSLAATDAILIELLLAKRQDPLDPIDAPQSIADVERLLQDAMVGIATYNRAVDNINNLVAQRRQGPQPTEAQAKQKIENLRRAKRRNEDAGVRRRIENYLAAKRARDRVARIRTEVQRRLKAANERSANHYYKRVNHHLEKFNASFRISEIKNSMSGNLGSVDYGLLVRGQPVVRRATDMPDSERSFKNTLSTGDKSTLAFAFFLAGLDRETNLLQKVIVFDDPLSSHDTHRQGRTVALLHDLCKRSAQVIVLSHDAQFLRRVSERCKTIEQTCYEIEFEGPENWSKALRASLDELCRTEHAALVDDLLAYYHRRAGQPVSIAPHVRRVLETHYRRSYTAYFHRDDNLGEIISKIREHGSGHPCLGDLTDLEHCNEVTSGKHHGDDAIFLPDQPIDPDDLHGVVKDCLRLLGAIRR